ncbi:uncharacterized protein ALTATR162_LOCUS11117 [Alternaria atra]|uniref:Uncharacterized protein n=1 Tax=Alternaria atra TaxID=119953 RepID=A0A8J2IF59_9PLEO|nr:uncharacterized protein ALTATR162_LOCUS11117 [Alternaria atra]CAG5184858.1 unnamed protein product [Alternaria atra]
MKNSVIALTLIGAAAAHPAAFRTKREVPQEHAHRNVNLAVNTLLKLNNPDNIQDSVFALLGAKAAAQGAGDIADADCLQQAVADQAFTNAKEAGDVEGMTMALIYRTLERNTGSVGLASVPCQSIQAVNPEIAALQQHQDPAGDGAQALNKQIAEELARQIASVGGDPLMANEASTFAPGKIGDPTGAGNTCDVDTDDAGCINTQNLRVDDLTEDEIAAAVAGVSGAAGNGTAAAGNAAAGNKNSNAGNGNNANAGNDNNNANAGNNNNANACNNNNANAGNGGNNAAAGNAAAGNAATGNAATGNAATGNAATGNAATGNAATGNAATGNAASGNGAAAFGSCDPTITFGIPSDGRKEEAFEPTDLSTFNHGSAQKIDIISQFICSQMSNKCNVDAAAVSTCDAAASAASGLTGQAAADAFNSALGL